MEFKGTKGKWFLRENKKQVVSEYDCLISTVLDGLGNAFNSNMQNTEIQEANAKLIACAPEMLEILKKVLRSIDIGDVIEYQSQTYYDIEDLINKATE